MICILNWSEDKKIEDHLLQMISKAVSLSEDKSEIVIMLNYESSINEQKLLFRHGAGQVISLCSNNMKSYIRKAGDIIKENKYKLVMFPASKSGKKIASILATRISVGLTADCINIKKNGDDSFSFFRAAINSSIIAEIKCVNSEIEMCTVRKNCFKAEAAYDDNGIYKQIEVEEDKGEMISDIQLIKQELLDAKKSVELDKAEVIIGVGRGAADKASLELVYKTAEKIGASVACTRSLVDAGVFAREYQVGQSGTIISPRVYIAIGISGAIQHMIGINDNTTIVAINPDKNAPVFSYADYCIYDKCTNVLNELNSVL